MTPQHAFEQSHPWLTFSLDLNRLSGKTWLLLGEIGSKCHHLAGAALPPDVAQELHLMYLSKGVYGTAAIEGNTLTEAQVQERIEGKLPLPPSREYLGAEIDSLMGLHNEIGRDVAHGELQALSVDRIMDFNQRILESQPLGEDVVPGRVREHSVVVGVSIYRGAPAGECEYLLGKLVDWLNGLHAPEDRPELGFPIAVLKAVLAHLYLAWIHPFGDGNGRTARLVEFQLMLMAGAPTPAAHLLSNHYNLTRAAYLKALDETSRLPGYPVEIFIDYALQGLADQLREQIQQVQAFQMAVMWQKIIHDSFRNEDTPAKRRQRHLLLDMTPGVAVPKAKLREVSPRVAEGYVGATTKTITRDVNALEKRGLLRRTPEGFMPNSAMVDGLRPVVNEDPQL